EAKGNTIGGTLDNMGNVIAGNNVGIELRGFFTTEQDGTTVNGLYTTVIGNYIGITRGNVPIGNGFGIKVNDSPATTIGGANNARNFISYNLVGISIFGRNATGNLVEGNSIGLGTTGTTHFPRISREDGIVQTGVFIDNASGNEIRGNKITGSAVGVYIF